MSLVVAAEEAEAVQVSGEALLQIAARLNGTDFPLRRAPSLTAAIAPMEEDPSFISIEDGAGFLDLLKEVVNHYAPSKMESNGDSVWSSPITEQQRVMALRHVIFEIQPELMSTIIAILHAPHMMTEDDDVCRLFRGALFFLQSVLLSCCVPWDPSISDRSSNINESELSFIESMELSAMIGDLLERLGVVVVLSDLLYDEFPFSVRQLAAQILFVMLLRGGSSVKPTPNTYVRNALSAPDRLAILLSVVVASPSTVVDSQEQRHHISQDLSQQFYISRTDTSSRAASESNLLSLRLYAAACLRELANTHFVSLANLTVLDMLQQLMMAEQNSDLRALAIETVNLVVLQNESSIWISVPFKKELVAWCVTQLEKEQSNDALRATLSLIETLILKDTAAGTEGESQAPGSYAPKVCEMLLALFADRALASLIGKAAVGQSSVTGWDRVPFFRTQYEQRPQRNTQCERKRIQDAEQKHSMSTRCIVSQTTILAARSLRLLIQHAPHYLNGPFYLMQHLSSSSQLLEVTMRLSEQQEMRQANSKKCNSNGMDELKLVLSVELAVIISLGLVQDPRARQLLVSEFTEYPSEARQVRRALISNLNLVSLSYFGSVLRDFRIIDANGTLLNVLENVSWDTPDRPSRAAVHDLFTSQETRWNAGDKMNDLSSSHNDGRRSGSVQDTHKVHHDCMKMSLVPSETRHQRLSFIILSYAIHYTFKFASDETLSSTGADITAAPHDIPRLLSKVNHKKKINRDTVHDPSRYYGSFLVDSGNDSNKMRSSPIKQQQEQEQQQKQEQKQKQREPFLSPVPRDPRRPCERLMSPSRPPWLNLTDDAPIAAETKDPQAYNPQHNPHGSVITKKDTKLFQQYQRGLQLFTDLAQFYSPQPTSVALAKRTIVYEATSEGLFRRQKQSETQKTMSQILGEESDSKGKQMNESIYSSRFSVRRDNIGVIGPNTRSWSIEELQEGDLFYFCIPFTQLTLVSLRQIRRQAEQHAQRIKKLLSITPQSAKARRWLLHDAVVNILPGIVHTLSQFIQWFDMYDEETVKLPLLIFFRGDEQQRLERQRQVDQEEQQQWDQAKPEDHLDNGMTSKKIAEREETSLPLPDEVALHAGNLIPLARQVSFYLQRRQRQNIGQGQTNHPAQQQQTEDLSNKAVHAGDVLQQPYLGHSRDYALSPWHNEGPLTQRKSVMLQDIDREISRLQGMEFGDEGSANLLMPDVSASPYGRLQLQRAYGNKDFEETGDSELSEDEDDFDELKGL